MLSLRKGIEKVLAQVVELVCRWPLAILLASIALAVASGYIAFTKFAVINNTAQLLEQDSAVSRNYAQLEKDFGTDELYLVLIQSPDVQRNREVADKVGKFLETLKPFVERSYYKIDFSKLDNRFLFLLPIEDLKLMQSELSLQAQAISKAPGKLNFNAALEEANRSFDDKYLRKADNWKEFIPFIEQFKGILNKLADRLEGSKKPAPKPVANVEGKTSAFDQFQDVNAALVEHEYFSFEQGRSLLVLGMRGQLETDSVSPFSKTVEKIRNYLAELNKEYPDVKLGLTGQPVLSDDELQTSTHDTEVASVITLALIGALFFFSYRNLQRPFFALIALAIAIMWSLAFTMLVVGHFNIISFAVIPMVLGIGIDFGIQLLSRYEEELGREGIPRNALLHSLQNTGVAIITGGTTTAIAFYTLCFNQFVGLRELGAIAGSSILFCIVANLVVLPAIFYLRDRNRSRELLLTHGANSNWGSLAGVDRVLTRAPRTVIGVSVVLTLLSVWGIFHVKFDYNLLNLQNPKLDSVRVLHEVFRVTDNSTLYASVVAKDLDEARALEKKLVALPSVARVDSITQMMPEDQEAKMPVIRKIAETMSKVTLAPASQEKIDPARVRVSLEQLLASCHEGVAQAKKFEKISKRAKQATEVLGGLIPPLERASKAIAGLTPEQLNRRLNRAQDEVFGAMQRNLIWLKKQQFDRPIGMDDLPDTLRHQFVSPSGKILLQVYAKKDIWERPANVEFVDQLRTVDPNVTGTPVQNYEYIGLLRDSFLSAAVWAFVAITVIIFLHFQNVKYTALAILPLVLAVAWRTGLMGWWDIEFNPANIVTLPLIIGIDVAYGVYIVERFREDGRFQLFETSTGKAIVMTGLTAFFGFVSLLVSRYRGMHSIGLLMSMGIAIGMVTTIIVLPQVLCLLKRKRSDGDLSGAVNVTKPIPQRDPIAP